jgi:glycolate oxidase subunit GlcD
VISSPRSALSIPVRCRSHAHRFIPPTLPRAHVSSSVPSAPPSLSPSLVEALRSAVGEAAVITEADRLLVYESDGLTQYRVPPAAVALPANGAELREVIRILAQADHPFVMRGAGTGLSGGALAMDGGVVVGTARMGRILEVDPANRRARVEPGVVNTHLTRATRAHGLIYAPDPSSQSACTLGGNVAENSGGPHCLKYGVTSRYVTGLHLVLPDGSEARLGGMGREEEGLDLVGLFVGSEGCFGAASEIEVSLVPEPPGVRTLLALFESVEAAGVAVTAIMARGLLPAALEIVDRETIRAVEASVFAAGYPTHVGAALVVEFDGLEEGLDEEVELAALLCREAGAEEVRMAASEEERAGLWQGRKKAFGAMGRIAPDLLVQDATVPRSQLPAVLAQIAEIGTRYGLRVANVFHAGDGNLHPNLLFDRRDAEELARVEAASGEIMEVCIQAGGTITGEHGVGVDKRRYMHRVYSPQVLRRMGETKDVFDPRGRCNPGKVLPDGFGPPWSGDREGKGAGPRGGASPDPRGGALPPSSPEARLHSLVGRLQEVLSPGAVTEEGPTRPVCPSSEEEVAAVLRLAAEHRVPVRPVGQGLEKGEGSGQGSPGAELRLGTGRLTAVLDHAPEDLQVQVSAGVSLKELSRAVASHGHWLPADPPGGGDVSMGGVVATGVSGPLAAGYGRVRDQLLGLTLVDGAGQVLALGGRVVKNVAGFDLVRLAAGSRGVLGIITSVTLRLFPLPARERTALWSVPDPDTLSEVREALMATGVPLAALDAAVEPHARGIAIMARLQGSAEAVDAMTRSLEARAGRAARVLEGEASREWWEGRSKREARGDLLVRIGGLPAEGPRRMEALLPLVGPGSGEGTDAGTGSSTGTGPTGVSLALGLLDGRLRTLAPAKGEVDGMGREAVSGGEAVSALEALSSLRVVRWPEAWRREGILPPVSPPVDPPRARAIRLEEEIMARFDPAGVLPGLRETPR